jgi:hypothetical protein
MSIGLQPAGITPPLKNIGFGCGKCAQAVELLVKAGADSVKAARYVESNAPLKGTMNKTLEEISFTPHEPLAQSTLNTVRRSGAELIANINKNFAG